MDRKFLEDLGLEKEAVDKVLNQNGTELTALKTQLKTKDTEIKTLRDDLTAANSKLADLESVDVEGLRTQLADEKAGRLKDKKQMHLRGTLELAGCKDVDYLIYKLGDTVEFADDGELKDKEGFLESVKKTYAAQFEEPQTVTTGSSGDFPRGGKQPITREEFAKMGYRQRVDLFNSDPETYQNLKE